MPYVKMKESDYLAIRAMGTGGILQNLDPKLFPTNGFVKVLCPDGDTTPEAIKYFHYGICADANGESVCTHLASVTGGPGAIPKDSPMHILNYKGVPCGEADKLIFSTIEGALKVKGRDRIKNIALVPHCPCGMATLSELSVWENFALTIRAKQIIRAEFPKTFERIVVTPHVNFEGYQEALRPRGHFRTYILQEELFAEAFAARAEYIRPVQMVIA